MRRQPLQPPGRPFAARLYMMVIALAAATACQLLVGTGFIIASLSAVEMELFPPYQPEHVVQGPRILTQSDDEEEDGTDVDAVDTFSFSACLLIKDDNRILPEWLAYHYTTLPLRHLVVAVDPFSLTDPSKIILDEWRNNDDLGMRIDVWHDEDYMVYDSSTIPKPFPKDSGSYKIAAHRERQPSFYKACLDHLRRENRTWTVLIDSDEYLLLNTFNLPGLREERCERKAEGQAKKACFDRLAMLSASSSNATMMTVAEFIERDIRNNEPLFKNTSALPCILVPRVFFGGQETSREEISSYVPAGFNLSLFDTLRFGKYLRYSLGSEWPGKSVVDASRFHEKSIDNAHQAMRDDLCVGDVFPDPFTSVFRVQHYLGSLEDFLTRPGDSRRTSEKYSLFSTSGGGRTIDNGDIRPWLKTFVEQVGDKQARRLTQEARLRATLDDTVRVREAAHRAEPNHRSFITYIPSSWETLWSGQIGRWKHRSVQELLTTQKGMVDEFVRHTCPTLRTIDRQEYCDIDWNSHRFCYNLSAFDEAQNIISGYEIDTEASPLVLSVFVLENEETGELYADYIEPLVGDLRHPLETGLTHAAQNGSCVREHGEWDGSNASLRARMLADTTRLPTSSGSYYYSVGATGWATDEPSIAGAMSVWTKHGVEFDAYYIWGVADVASFYATVPERIRDRVHYFEQATIRSERDNGSIQKHAPMLIRESRSLDDYVVLHLMGASEKFNTTAQLGFLDDLIWEEHNYVEWIDEMIWSDAGHLNDTGEAYEYLVDLRERGVRAHAYVH